MKPVKAAAVTGAATLLLAFLFLVGANFLVSPDQYKSLLEKTAHENGIILKIAGGLHWSFMPTIGFAADDVQLQQLPRDKPEQKIIHFDKVTLSVDILDLLGGKLHIKAFSIDNAIFLTNNVQTLRFNNVLLKVTNANNRGENFPVELTLDDTKISGNISINTADKLHLDVDLHGDQIDLDRYAPHEKTTSKPQTEKQVVLAGKQKNNSATKDEPLPLASLFQAPGNYKLRFDHVTANHIQLSSVVFDARVDGTRATLNTLDANLYQGKLHATGSIELSTGQKPKFQINTVLEKVDIAPFLTDLQQEKPAISAGKINLTADLHGKGSSRNKIIATLSGNASADIDGLVLRGTNLEKLACDAATLVQKIAPDNKISSESTTIRNLHAESRIVNGIALLAPLTASMDTIAISGSGPVNLVNETMDIRLAITINDAHFCPAINKAVSDIAWLIRCEGNYKTAQDSLCAVDKPAIGKLISEIAIKNFKNGDGSLKDKLRKLFH